MITYVMPYTHIHPIHSCVNIVIESSRHHWSICCSICSNMIDTASMKSWGVCGGRRVRTLSWSYLSSWGVMMSKLMIILLMPSVTYYNSDWSKLLSSGRNCLMRYSDTFDPSSCGICPSERTFFNFFCFFIGLAGCLGTSLKNSAGYAKKS